MIIMNKKNHSNVSSVRDTYRFKRKTSIDRNVILKGYINELGFNFV